MADKPSPPSSSSLSPSLEHLRELEEGRKLLKRKMGLLLQEERATKRARMKLLARARHLSEADLVLLLSEKQKVHQHEESCQTDE